MRLWDCSTSALTAAPGDHFDQVDTVHFSLDGSRFAVSNHKHIQLRDGNTGAHIATITRRFRFLSLPSIPRLLRAPSLTSIAISANFSRLALVYNDGTIQLWDGNTGAYIGDLRHHTRSAASVAFSTDGLRLAVPSDNTVMLWDSNKGACIATLKGHSWSVTSVTFSTHGSRLASVSYENTI
jgi:WD40 repeat protein